MDWNSRYGRYNKYAGKQAYLTNIQMELKEIIENINLELKRKQEEKKVEVKEKKTSTENNIVSILLYALAIAAALGFNDFTKSLLNQYSSFKSQTISKAIYVILMFTGALLLAYFTKSSVPI